MEIDQKKVSGDLSRPAPVALRAGPFSLELHGCDLRHIMLGGREVMQRLYMGLRDQNWGTLENRIVHMNVRDEGDSFSVEFKASNRKGDIAFDWEGKITGSSEGVIVFDFSGVALSDFPRARISLCALYPWSAREIECLTTHHDGTTEKKALPRLISPHQPFMDIVSISMFFPTIGETVTTFSGETFEMEDQRNWTDASFKVYGTPIALPSPVIVKKGEIIRQTVRLECRNLQIEAWDTVVDAPNPEICAGNGNVTMPQIGLSFAPDDAGAETFAKALSPALVRVYLDYTTCSHKEIEQYFTTALSLSMPLLVEPFFQENADVDLEHAKHLLATAPKEKIWGVSPLGTGQDVSRIEWLDNLRTLGLPLGWGTDGFPVHINRNRPGNTAIDFCVFPALPQVHSFDNMSIIDNLPGMTAVAENARSFQPAPVVVAPITFNWRSNPVAYAPEPARADDSILPVGVDSRQQSLFGAAWTAACCQALAQGGVTAAVFFERLIGWKGLRESEHPAEQSVDFPATPNEIFPPAVTLSWLAPYSGGTITAFATSSVRGVGGFAVKKQAKEGVFLYNLGLDASLIMMKDFSGLWRMRTLDVANQRRYAEQLGIEGERREVSEKQEFVLPPCSLTYLEKAK